MFNVHEVFIFNLRIFSLLINDTVTFYVDDDELNEAVNSEFLDVLVKCLSLHIPGWSETWTNMFRTHYNLATFALEAFKISNKARLSKQASLVGAHKSPEALEVSALANFLMEHFR